MNKCKDKWALSFTINRCIIHGIGKRDAVISYNSGNDAIKRKRDYLEVIITTSLLPRHQIIEVRNKANQLLGIIKC